MHALASISGVLFPLLNDVHARRLAAVFAAVESLLRGGCLTLTALGRNCAGAAAVRHAIKRIDRLLGNRLLHAELPLFLRAMTTLVLTHLPRPIILVDWTVVGERQWALVAAVACSGRAMPIYFEVHRESVLGNAGVERRFLRRFARLLPKNCAPVIVTDAGFRNPWFRAVRELGWDFVGRLGKNVRTSDVDASAWSRVGQYFRLASSCALDLGWRSVAQSAPLEAKLVLYKGDAKRRRTLRERRGRGVRPGSTKFKHYQRRGSEPWMLVTSLRETKAAAVVSIYSRRMQIEETFRDAKSHRYGWSFEDARSRHVRRLEVLLLVAAIAMLVALTVGKAAERAGLHKRYQASTRSSRRVLSVLCLGTEILRSNNRDLAHAEIAEALRLLALGRGLAEACDL